MVTARKDSTNMKKEAWIFNQKTKTQIAELTKAVKGLEKLKDANISHGLNDNAQKFIQKQVQGIKPRIGPWHLLGASLLAGAGMAAGSAAWDVLKSTGEEVVFGGPLPPQGTKTASDKYEEEELLIKEAFLRGFGRAARSIVNTGKRVAGVSGRGAKSVTKLQGKMKSKAVGQIGLVKAKFNSGYTGKPLSGTNKQIKSQAVLKSNLSKRQALRSKGKLVNPKPNLPGSTQPKSLMDKGRAVWNKATNTQKNIAKGTGLVAAGAGTTQALNSSMDQNRRR